jgi:hypothetical protein
MAGFFIGEVKMAWAFTAPLLGLQPISVTDTVQRHPLGLMVPGYDTVLGGGEFIYAVGVAGTVAGSLATYNSNGRTTTLSPAGVLTGVIGAPVGVAMSANVANQYGWYQIGGQAVVAKDGSAPAANAPVYLAAAAGQVTATQAAGRQLNNAQFAASALAGATTVNVTLGRSFIEGQIT